MGPALEKRLPGRGLICQGVDPSGVTCVRRSWVQQRRLHQTHIVGRERLAPKNTFSTRARATQRRRSGMSGRPQLATAFEAGQTTERLADRARWKKGTGRHRNQSKGITRRTHGAGGSRVLQKGSHRSAEHLELSWLDVVPVRRNAHGCRPCKSATSGRTSRDQKAACA